MTPHQAQQEIDKILEACEPEMHSDCAFEKPLQPGTFAVSVDSKSKQLILIRDVSRSAAMWVFLNIRNSVPTCNSPKFHAAK